MKNYLDLCQDILDNGFNRKNIRTGEVSRSVFARQLRFNLKEEFPIVKAKFTAFKTMSHELLWFLKGSTNIGYLTENNCHIWDEWADKNGELGPVYGKQWRNWTKHNIVGKTQTSEIIGEQIKTRARYITEVTNIDQIAEVIQKLKHDPSDRRMMVMAYNVGELDEMALPPCHYTFQFFVNDKNELSCMWQQRSVDTFLGLPFNIASYALLTHMIAQVCDLQVGELIFSGGDVHLYENQFEATREMLKRPLIETKAKLWLNPEIKNIDDFTANDILLNNYEYHPSIKVKVVV